MPVLKNPQIAKSEIIDTLAELHPEHEREVLAEIFESLLDTITEALVCDIRVSIRGFGALQVKELAAGPSWVPAKKEFVEREARRKVTFKPFKGLLEKINRPPSERPDFDF